MTRLLEKAFTEASKLSTQEQNLLAQWLLELLTSEQRWDRLFESSQDQLAQLAEEALMEHRRGKTRLLNPDDL